MKFMIKVTQDYIDNGIKEDGDWCPVALAIKELPLIDGDVSVDGDSILLPDGEALDLPASVSDFVHAFDAGALVKPFSFEVDIPEDYIRW